MRLVDRLFVGFFMVCIALIVVVNIVCNPEFFRASAITVVQALIVLLVSYYLVQHNTDFRKSKENIEKILDKIDGAIHDPLLQNISSVSSGQRVLSAIRNLNNKLGILAVYAEEFDFKPHVEKLSALLKEYDELFGNHVDDLSFFESSSQDLQRPLLLMDNVIDQIKVDLYKAH